MSFRALAATYLTAWLMCLLPPRDSAGLGVRRTEQADRPAATRFSEKQSRAAVFSSGEEPNQRAVRPQRVCHES